MSAGGTPAQPPAPLDERGLPRGYLFKPDLEITPREARAALADPGRGAVLIDCRTPEEYDCSKVAGSTLIPVQEMGQRLDEVEDLGGREILVLCHHGVRSMKATLLLRQAGFESVRSIAGGIDLWSLAVDPSVPRYDKSTGKCVVVK
jgi:adenylyltransferase/sulfurtransferase